MDLDALREGLLILLKYSEYIQRKSVRQVQLLYNTALLGQLEAEKLLPKEFFQFFPIDTITLPVPIHKMCSKQCIM
ncbi:hypothetical protein SK128_010565 [Halocaridina rubra]|uniref:Uncharacterized protein n=1 Tax=Halocaridina rubra TaxID=373956 RepID=A0AAN8WIE2_HALRR